MSQKRIGKMEKVLPISIAMLAIVGTSMLLNNLIYPARKKRGVSRKRRHPHRGGAIEPFGLSDKSELPPSSINDHVERVVYINLPDRTDRRSSIEQVLSVFNPDKVVRLDATPDLHGHIGCTKSHIAALEMAIKNGWKNVLIVEDDMKWSKVAESYPAFERLVAQPYDVIMLGSMSPVYDSGFKLTRSATLTAYLVNSNYYQTLLGNFKEGLAGLERKSDDWKYCIDLYMNRLMPTGNWRVVIPSLCVQTPNYSNIRGATVDYTATTIN